MRVLSRTSAMIATVLFLLVSLPAPVSAEKGHRVELEYAGFISCSVTVPNTFRGDTCETVSQTSILGWAPLDDENTRSAFSVPLDAHLTTMVLRLEVADQSILPPRDPVLDLWWMNPPAAIPVTTGPDGTMVTYTFSGDEGWNQEPREASLIAELDNSRSQAALNLRINIHLGLFYDGAKVPDGYVPGV